MGYKRINVAIEENLLKDVDALIKAGFYKNRREIIAHALLKIEPLKTLAEKRRVEVYGKIIKKMSEVTKPVEKLIQKSVEKL